MPEDHTIHPSPRPHIGLRKSDDVTEKAPELVEESAYITPVEDGYHIEITVPTRRATGIAANVKRQNESVLNLLTAHREPAETKFTAHARSPVAALGILDVLLESIGHCRVCGDLMCTDGFAYRSNQVVHRTELEDEHYDPETITSSASLLLIYD